MFFLLLESFGHESLKILILRTEKLRKSMEFHMMVPRTQSGKAVLTIASGIFFFF